MADDPRAPSWMSYSRAQAIEDPEYGCAKKYFLYTHSSRKREQSDAAKAGEEMHSHIEYGIKSASFSDPIFTQEKCQFLARNVLGVDATQLFPVIQTDGSVFLERPDPGLLGSLVTELDLGEKNVKVEGVKIFGRIDLARLQPPWAVLVDWKKSDYSRRPDQLAFYGMCLRERWPKIERVMAYQYYLRPYKKAEYFDKWVFGKVELDAAKEKFRTLLREVGGRIDFEPKPCKKSCVDAFGGAGCAYYEDCEYAYGKHHQYSWDDYNVPRVQVSGDVLTKLKGGAVRPGVLGFGFRGLTMEPLRFIKKYEKSPVRLELPGGRYLWSNDFAGAAKWLQTVLTQMCWELVKPYHIHVLPNGVVIVKE